MNALLVTLVLTAAPAMRAPADAEFAYFVPKLSDLEAMVPFLDAAGERAGLLRREGWRNDVHPLLRVDITRKDSLVEAGIDSGSAATLSYRGTLSWSCVTLADVKKFEAACSEKLKSWGVVFRKDADGSTLVGSKDSLGRVLAGYALKGKESCAISASGASVEKPLMELGKLMGKAPAGAMWKTAAALPGQAVLISPMAVVGLKAKDLTLTSEFKSARLPLAKLAGAGATPYGGTSYDAMVWARMRVEPAQLPVLLAQLTANVGRLCPACDSAAMTDAVTALAPAMTGNALVLVPQAKVKGSLRTFAGRFFSVQLALLGEASDPKAAREALESLQKVKGAKALENGEGYSLLLREGEVKIGVRGSHVYFGNDGAAIEAALTAVPAEPGKQAHGVEFGVDPSRVAKGLSQVPLVDVLAVPELVALVGLSAEGGPLLLASEKMRGYADTDANAAARGQLVWPLKKQR